MFGGGDLAAQRHRDAESLEFPLVPTRQPFHVCQSGRRRRQVQGAAEAVGALGQMHAVTQLRRPPCGLHAGRSAADHQHAAGVGDHRRGREVLTPHAGVHRAGDRLAVLQPAAAPLHGGDTRADPVGVPAPGLGDPVLVRQQRPSQPHGVAVPAAQGRLGALRRRDPSTPTTGTSTLRRTSAARLRKTPSASSRRGIVHGTEPYTPAETTKASAPASANRRAATTASSTCSPSGTRSDPLMRTTTVNSGAARRTASITSQPKRCVRRRWRRRNGPCAGWTAPPGTAG